MKHEELAYRLIDTIIRLEKLHLVLDGIEKEYEDFENRIRYSFTFDNEKYDFYIEERINDDRFDEDNLYCWYQTTDENGDIDDYFSLDYFKYIVGELYNICLKKGLVE